jgi:hypothetical protein
MKRAVGKTSEYSYDVTKAIKEMGPVNSKNLIKLLDAPIFTKIFSEISSSAKI